MREVANARQRIDRRVTRPEIADAIKRTDPVVKKAREVPRKIDKRPHCKTRPNRTKGSGGGGGKRFVPWC